MLKKLNKKNYDCIEGGEIITAWKSLSYPSEYHSVSIGLVLAVLENFHLVSKSIKDNNVEIEQCFFDAGNSAWNENGSTQCSYEELLCEMQTPLFTCVATQTFVKSYTETANVFKKHREAILKALCNSNYKNTILNRMMEPSDKEMIKYLSDIDSVQKALGTYYEIEKLIRYDKEKDCVAFAFALRGRVVYRVVDIPVQTVIDFNNVDCLYVFSAYLMVTSITLQAVFLKDVLEKYNFNSYIEGKTNSFLSPSEIHLIH